VNITETIIACSLRCYIWSSWRLYQWWCHSKPQPSEASTPSKM